VDLEVPLGAAIGGWSIALAVVLTYLLHSTAWAAAAALLTRSEALSTASRHALWRAAVLGPVLSAGASMFFSRGLELRLVTRSPALTHNPVADMIDAAARAGLEPPTLEGAASVPLVRALVCLVLLAVLLGALRFVGSALSLRWQLRGRAPLTSTDVLHRFAGLCRRIGRAHVVLSVSEGLSSPLVIGTSEVCMPLGLLEALPAADGDAVLAHELAHIERGDGVWFPVVGALQSLLWFQPLNHWLAACFRDSAELACDDRAVELTGSPLALARALLHVAESTAQARQPLLAPTMARSQSGLVPRVRRLTSAPNPSLQLHARWRVALQLLIVGGALATLSVRVATARSEPPSVARKAAQAGPVAAGPDLSSQNAQMLKLTEREQQLTRDLVAAEAAPDAAREGSPAAVRLLELQQALRHVRATQAWLEARFVHEWPTAKTGRP
jgi:beta-lactamase regulating signal transducer with metallopeptidase domain